MIAQNAGKRFQNPESGLREALGAKHRTSEPPAVVESRSRYTAPPS